VLDRLMLATMNAGGTALRLVPGRRMLVLSREGEREVHGDVQSLAAIEKLLAPVLPVGGLAGLAARGGERIFELSGVGSVGLRAEVIGDSVAVTLTLLSAPPADAVPEPSRPAPPAARPATSRTMDGLLRALVDEGASDLHLSSGCPPMLRVDGEMRLIDGVGEVSEGEARSLLLSIMPERNRTEFERRHDTDFAYEIPGTARFRCNVFLDRKGPGGVFRVIPAEILSAEAMGLAPEILALCQLPKGLVLVTGPTGSGKSTTLAALVDHINSTRKDHIVTIEDPIEFVHASRTCLINQR